MPLANLVVVSVVGRGHFKAAGSEVHLDVVVFDNRYLPVDQRNEHLLATQSVIAFIGGIHANSGICHNGFGTGSGDYQEVIGRIAFTVRNKIAEMVEMALGIAVDNLVVRYGGMCHGIPVDHAVAVIDQPLLVEIHECGRNGVAQCRLHGKLGTVPVAGCSELTKLLENDAAVLLFPLPGIFEELLASQVFLFDSPLGKPCHDLALGGYASVVGTGHPAGVLAVHTRLAYEHVVQGVVEHMAHMEYARYVGRGDNNRVGLPGVRF